jgi:DUF4097 and DUF4098 domain-containing protein YvlB
MKLQRVATWALALAVLPAMAAAEGMIEERRNMAPDGTVTVSNVAGEIEISAWDSPAVKLVAELGSGQELAIDEHSQGIRIEVVNSDDKEDYDEASLRLTVPEGASIVAEGVSADLIIRGLRGDSVTAETVSGDVEVEAAVARVELSSVSGDVRFSGSAGRAAVESVSGDIDLEGIGGEVAISTVSGDAALQGGNIDRGQFQTVSGTMKIALAVADGGRVTVESMNGDVMLYLPGDQQAEFSAQTFSGDIDSAWGDVRQESFGPGSQLKHVEGESGSLIRVESFSGDISISRR